MNEPIDPRLAEILACPDCGAELQGVTGGLACSGCRREFEVLGGIPVLLPRGFDLAHLEEEKKLGDHMVAGMSAGESFSERQWEASKKDFWGFVGEKTRGRGELAILNAGCGIDKEFLESGSGNFLVAFDLMCDLLAEMKSKRGSRFNAAGAVQSLPFRENSFDGVCCIDLIHHETGEIEKIIGSFHKVLKPGGMLFLEDINAWALFQFWKSILLPRPLHRRLRSAWHSARRSGLAPAPYEFPTSVFRVARLLGEAGFENVAAVPQDAYPNASKAGYRLYRALARSERIRRFHNFHYLLYAEKKA